MPDPLSIASAAVGIVSLGIQTCQGLISYLQSVHDRKRVISDSLREIQTLASILQSLQDTVPELQRRGCTESTIIRQCLQDSEDKLLELQQFTLKLGGPLQAANVKSKTREAIFSLIYPFREGKLALLQHSLHNLLDHINLAVATSTLKSSIVREDRINTIGTSVQMVFQAQEVAVANLNTTMKQNSNQLRLLQERIVDIGDLHQQVLENTVILRHQGQNLSTKLTSIEASTRSSASNNRAMREMMERILEIQASQEALILDTTLQMSRIKETEAPDPVPMYRASEPMMLNNSTQFGSITGAPKIPLLPCTCESETHPFLFSYTFWNLSFHFEQESPLKHGRGCKLYGINKKTTRRIRAQLPLKLAWFSARMTFACFEYMNGANSLGISVRYRNVVPTDHSPVFKAFGKLYKWNDGPGPYKFIHQLELIEREILSLYRDGMASPTDRDEQGRSHTQMFVDMLGLEEWLSSFSAANIYAFVCADGTALMAAMRLLQTIQQIVQAEEVKFDGGRLVYRIRDTAPDKTLEKKRDMIASLAREFHVGPPRSCHRSELDSWQSVMSMEDVFGAMDLSPIGGAILLRSLHHLERCISYDPQSSIERVLGYNTLAIATPWPSGLRRLLTTEARNRIDDPGMWPYNSPLQWAITHDYIEAVDILMEAGCQLNIGGEMGQVLLHFVRASPTCVNVLASRLAERRRDLLTLAQQNVEIPHPLVLRIIADEDSAFLCDALDRAHVHIPPALRVPESYTTVYHCKQLPLLHFPIFFEKGFRNNTQRNDFGLTPVMVWRKQDFKMGSYRKTDEFFVALKWLHTQGLLDQTAGNRGINQAFNPHATGWHYLAAMFVLEFEDHEEFARPSIPIKMIQEITQVNAKDECACWCNTSGEGCSPLKSLLKVYIDHHRNSFCCIPKQKREMFVRHVFLHYTRDSSGLGRMNMNTMDPFVEIVRLLTFEALDMVHTCCQLEGEFLTMPHLPKSLDWCCKGHNLFASDPISFDSVNTTLHSREIGEPIADESQQQNVCLLNGLMDEFDHDLKCLDSSPKALEAFLWGPWRERISELFAVDRSLLGGMECSLDRVETYVLPNRVRSFLGGEFELLKVNGDGTYEELDIQKEGGVISVESVSIPPYCEWCDEQW